MIIVDTGVLYALADRRDSTPISSSGGLGSQPGRRTGDGALPAVSAMRPEWALTKFAIDVRSKVHDWFTTHRPILQRLDAQTRPQELISRLGDDLLARFKDTPLLDEYDVYEQLMTYWHSVMHDDVFLIMNEGWMDAVQPRKTIEDKDRKLSETPDLVVRSGRGNTKYKTDLIPPALIVARYLADEQSKVDELNIAADEATRAVEEYTDEHAVEEGLLAAALDDGKITKALATVRLKDAKREASDPDEIKALQHLIKLCTDEAAAKQAAKDAQSALNLATLEVRRADPA